jgi:hypothetical protein
MRKSDCSLLAQDEQIRCERRDRRVKIISWNINHQAEAWRTLLDSDADVALLQEAGCPPNDLPSHCSTDSAPWLTEGAGLKRGWRAAIARLSDRVDVEHLPLLPIAQASPGQPTVSRVGTLALANVRGRATGDTYTLASLYGAWENPSGTTKSHWIYADASVHRLISDLSMLIGQQRGHRVIAAGDLNILRGYGEAGAGSEYWARRYQGVFDRMEALGLPFAGPQAPLGGIQAHPWPGELPLESKNVPTFRVRREKPETATRQLDFVFASTELLPFLQVRALNSVSDWGPSDHCRIEILVGSSPQ